MDLLILALLMTYIFITYISYVDSQYIPPIYEQVPKRKITWLGYVNLLLAQFFFIRLVRVRYYKDNEDGIRVEYWGKYKVLYFIVPGTGWHGDEEYKSLGKIMVWPKDRVVKDIKDGSFRWRGKPQD